MLPPGFISYLIFDFAKKRAKKRKRIRRNFFLYSGVIYACICLIIALFMVLLQPSEQDAIHRFLIIAPLAGFLLGEIAAGISWLIWFRKEV